MPTDLLKGSSTSRPAWTKVDTRDGSWRPNWINAPAKVVKRKTRTGLGYSQKLGLPTSPFTSVCDGVVAEFGDRLVVHLMRPGIGLQVFIWICLAVPVILGGMFGPPRDRIFLIVIGVVAALAINALLQALHASHESAGDKYLVVDREKGTIELPRSEEKFARQHVVAWQWYQSIKKAQGKSIVVDLYLLVKHNDEVVRHFVMPLPTRSLVRRLSEFSGVPVEQVEVAWKDGDHSLDSQSPW